MYDFCQSLVSDGWAEALAAQQDAHREAVETRRAPKGDDTGWVYFAVIGDHIKIGWTSYPKGRWKTLRPDEVLHCQPGSLADEHRLHMAFAHLLDKGREWFRDDPELRAYISGLRADAA